MKKSIAITVVVTLVISLLAAIPVFAKSQPNECRAVFESDIIESTVGDDELDKGEVWFREDGSFKVEIEGESLVEGEEYDVLLWDLLGEGTYELGTITISEDGDGVLTGYLYDKGVQDIDIIPVIQIFSETDWEFVSGCYVPPAP